MPIKHKRIATRDDGAQDGRVQPSWWNDEHDIGPFLGAIIDLAVSPRTVPYVKSDGSAGLFSISDFGRALLAFDNAPALLASLAAPSLDSPHFINAPTAPTAPLNDNSTRLATMEALQAMRADLVHSSPAALDTLAELATALGNDANFATTMATALGSRVRFDATQSLTAGQKAQALLNLGVVLGNSGAAIGLLNANKTDSGSNTFSGQNYVASGLRLYPISAPTRNILFAYDPSADWGYLDAVDSASGAAKPLLLNPTGGFVGVGIYPPTRALDVGGTARLRGHPSYSALGTDASGNIIPVTAFSGDNVSITVPYTGAAPRSITSRGGDHPDVRDFGLIGSDPAVNTATMQRAHNTGLVIRYPGVGIPYSEISFSKGGIVGDGDATLLYSNSLGAGNAITYTGATPPLFRDFKLEPSGSKTGGAGILFLPSVGELAYPTVDNITVYGMPTSIDYAAVSHFTLTNSRLLNYTNAGAWVKNSYHADSGDSFIGGCTMNTAFVGGAGILQNSSGGLKVVGTKILGGSYGYRLAYNGAGATGDLMLAANSIEQCVSGAIVLERLSGTGTFGAIAITGNQTAICPYGIYADASGFLSQLAIGANNIALHATTGAAGISVGYANMFTIVGNNVVGRNSGDVGIATGGACVNGKVGGNGIWNCATPTSLGGSNISTAF